MSGPVAVEAQRVEPVDGGGDQLLVRGRRPRRVQALHHHPERALRVVARDPQRGVGEQAVRATQLPLREVGTGPHRGQPGEDDRILDVAGGALRLTPRPLQPAAVHARLASQHDSPRRSRTVRTQRGRALVGCRRSGVPAASVRPVRGTLQVGRRALV
jgi:hypothetical protein